MTKTDVYLECNNKTSMINIAVCCGQLLGPCKTDLLIGCFTIGFSFF